MNQITSFWILFTIAYTGFSDTNADILDVMSNRVMDIVLGQLKHSQAIPRLKEIESRHVINGTVEYSKLLTDPNPDHIGALLYKFDFGVNVKVFMEGPSTNCKDKAHVQYKCYVAILDQEFKRLPYVFTEPLKCKSVDEPNIYYKCPR